MRYFSSFMIGRNGFDRLNRFLSLIYVIIAVINAFARNTVLLVIIWILFLTILFRAFSKNLTARQKENDIFLKLSTKVFSKFKYPFMKIRDIKKFRYRKCRFCKATVRLPIKKGRHTVKCPACKYTFKVFIPF